MVTALVYVGCSLVALILLTFIYVVEDIQGKRIFLLKTRDKLDTFFRWMLSKIDSALFFFSNNFMRLLLHYGAHTILKRILFWLRTLEKRVEDLVRQNRKVAKDIRTATSKNHLDEIAQHKEETALSVEQREERLSR